jgi:hypothetical protein
MNFTVNEITNSIAGKPSLSECSVEELRQLTSHYPYFAPAQFLFVKKLKEENSWQLKEQIRKTALYVQNPLWLDHLLNSTAEAPVSIPINKEEVIPEPATEKKTLVTQEEVAENYSMNTAAETPFAILAKKEEVIPEPATKMEVPMTQEEVVENQLHHTAAEAPVIIPLEKEEFVNEPAAEMEIPVTHEEVVDQTRFARQPEFAHAESHAEQYQPELLVEMPKFKFEPVDPSKTQLTFEPFHTIDYFASQGIRPTAEEKPKDQFSRQLKSFTEWLKVMKKLPVTEIAAAVSVVDEKKVEKMAEVSINDREVVTEAMAEVWEKQGNRVKARDVYEKLSLLNPDKSSYFAAKIDHLKNL